MEGLFMRVSTVQCYQPMQMQNRVKKNVSRVGIKENYPQSDLVAFKAKDVIKGIGLGAVVGLGAITLLSGGTATPFAYGIYTALSAAAGGALGQAVEDAKKDNNSDSSY